MWPDIVIAKRRSRRGNLIVLPLLLALAACGDKPAPVVDSPTFAIDSARITVSGLSSGAYMAGQLHVAHSSLFSGLAIVAGGPYYCAEGSISKGIGPCVKGGDVGIDRLLAHAEAMESAGKIDELANLTNDPVWIFHGALDEVVSQEPSDAAVSMYAQLTSTDAVTYVTDIDVVHGLPTLETGAPCATFSTPFLNACDYDAAGQWLTALYSVLHERAVASGELVTVSQIGGGEAEMLEHAFLYVPQACAAGERCGLHVAMHGCSQSAEYVGDAFAAGSGLNEWAESNNLLVLYPQVASSKFAPLNPYGCWDWWGYTNEHYATREGPQIIVIKAMIDALAGTTL